MAHPTGNDDASAGRALLEVKDLVKEFPVRATGFLPGHRRVVHAVSGASLSIAPGETLGLVGESGSGKSTLARLVLRLIEPTSGEIRFEHDDVRAMSTRELRSFRQRAQLVFQDPHASFDPMASVCDSVSEPLRTHHGLRNDAARQQVKALFDLVGLSPLLLDRRPSELSGGQLQRAGIARALAVEPRMLVLDEPVSALDVSTQGQVINLLADLKDQLGIAYLFIAHDLAIVHHVSDRIAVMYLGQIVEVGTAEGIYEHPAHPYTQALLSAIPVPDPDGRRIRDRIRLTGEIPSPIDPPSGCRFRTRCPYAMDVCATHVPARATAAHGGEVWCHLHRPTTIDGETTTVAAS